MKKEAEQEASLTDEGDDVATTTNPAKTIASRLNAGEPLGGTPFCMPVEEEREGGEKPGVDAAKAKAKAKVNDKGKLMELFEVQLLVLTCIGLDIFFSVLELIMTYNALFPGNDYIHQLKLITQFIGTPSSASDIWFVTNEKARRFMLGLPSCAGADVRSYFPGADEGACDLLSQMLVLDPSRRITVQDALAHPYLAPIRDKAFETEAAGEIDWGTIEEVALTKENLQGIIWEDVHMYHPKAREEMKVREG